jgi:RNA polymerase sigma factor (sigma-70 family)
VIGAEPVSETLSQRAGALLAAYRDGDQQKMGELVDLVTPILWHTVRAQRLDREAAEDVLQTTWLSLVRSSHTITDSQAVLQWLIVSARREAWRVARRARRAEPQDVESLEVAAPAQDVPEEVALRNDTQSRLWWHIANLPERCRELLRVIAFADRPDYAAIASALGMPIGSIGPTRGRCMAKLRVLLANDPAWEL